MNPWILVALALTGTASAPGWAQQAGEVRPTCAIMPFHNLTGRPGSAYLASVIGQCLPPALMRTGTWQLVERAQLKKLLEEADLKDSDIVEGRPIRLVGVQVLILGEYRDEGGIVTVSARLVELASSRIVRHAAWSGHVSGLVDNMAPRLSAMLAEQELTAELMPPQLQQLFKRACRLLEERDFDQAIDVCTQILDRRPRHLDTLLVRGYAELQKKGWTRYATKDFQAVLDIDAKNTAAALGLAKVKLTGDRRLVEESLALLQKILRDQPDNGEALLLAATAMERLGRITDAMLVADRAAEAIPEYSPAWQTLARLQLAQEVEEKAVNSAKKATVCDPDDPFAWKLLGDAQFASKDRVGAKQSYLTALKRDPPPDLKKQLNARLQRFD
ncbi:MAG: tetratricopeptide repeat protein [Planctomycetota bacterium]